ncbi:MAG: glycosyltransferase family 4 protein [Oligoflexia bacterium]|nr:glycosyltransferase family 4 protein [Oligoflexia bacterium]
MVSSSPDMPSPSRPDKLHLAVICPHFPPQPGGVSDYAARLCQEFVREGHAVTAWTAEPRPEAIPGVDLRPIAANPASGWNAAAFRRIEREIRECAASAVILQYTPYLYSPRRWGIHPALSSWFANLGGRLGRPVALLAHELHYPLGLSADRLCVGTPQFFQFLALAHFADLIWFTYEIPLLRYRRAFPWAAKRFDWFPVGSAIDPRLGESAPLPSEAWHEGKRLLLQFGSSHPSRSFDHSLRALKRAHELLASRGQEAALAFVGLDDSEVQQKLREHGWTELAPLARGLGYQSAAATSAWMRRAEVVLAPFVDGISTRRSSVMTALAHGKAVVTTRGVHTDPSVGWDRFTALAGADDPEGFARSAAELLADGARAAELGRAALARYEELFSWETIARGMLARLAPPNR